MKLLENRSESLKHFGGVRVPSTWTPSYTSQLRPLVDGQNIKSWCEVTEAKCVYKLQIKKPAQHGQAPKSTLRAQSSTKHFSSNQAPCYPILSLSHWKRAWSCLSHYRPVQVDKNLHKKRYEKAFKHSSTVKMFKVRLDFFFLNKIFGIYMSCSLCIFIKDWHSQWMLETASYPNKQICTKNWLHKLLNTKCELYFCVLPCPHRMQYSPNKPCSFLDERVHSFQYYSLKTEAPFYSALFSNQKKTKMCRNFKTREKQIWHASNYICPSSTLTADPSDPLFIARLHQNHSTCFHKNKSISPTALGSMLRWGIKISNTL